MSRPRNPGGWHPRAWPVALKVPLAVAVLMVVVAVILSNQVLERLAESQRQTLRGLTSAYLDGLSGTLLPHVLRDDVWEVFDALERAGQAYESLSVRFTIVTRPDGSVLAASDPRRFPVDSDLPAALTGRFDGGGALVLDETAGQAWVSRPLAYQALDVGRIVSAIDITAMLAERRDVLLTLVLTNAALALLLAALGYLLVRRMLRPVSILTGRFRAARDGGLEPIPAAELGDPASEFGRLFRGYNDMASALDERDRLSRQLAREEKLASLGRLTSGMAHEINNPLGGLFNAVDTLRRHGGDAGVRRDALDLLERGLTGIRDVVRAALVVYKGGPAAGGLARADLDDLQFLVKHEVARRRLRLDWRDALPERLPEGGQAVDGAALRQAALNLLLNALAATPPGGAVVFEAGLENGPGGETLRIAVTDSGAGMPAAMAARLTGPEAPERPPGEEGGLGLWMVRRLVERLGARAEVEAGPGGTRVSLWVPLGAERGAEDLLDDVA